MNDELDRYYELLGVAPGTSGRELKEAYRDLAKVWHPDRFSHDPRLQRKAQEKLKEINEAYERLTSGWGAARPRPNSAPYEPRATAAATTATTGKRKRSRLTLLTALVFCAVFFAALSSTLLPPGAPPTPEREPPAGVVETTAADKGQQPEGGARAAASPPPRGKEKERQGRQPAAEATSGGEQGTGTAAPTLRPMPTVTVAIDAVNGMRATRDCPNVSTMTYPAGNEPRRYCTVQHKTRIVPPSEPAQSKGSR